MSKITTAAVIVAADEFSNRQILGSSAWLSIDSSVGCATTDFIGLTDETRVEDAPRLFSLIISTDQKIRELLSMRSVRRVIIVRTLK